MKLKQGKDDNDNDDKDDEDLKEKEEDIPFVAFAVHERVHAPIEQIVLGAKPGDPVGTLLIVLSAATIRFRMSSDLRVPLGHVALPAPLCPGND